MSDDAVTPDIDAPWSPGSLTIIKSFFVSVTVEHHELCFLFAHAAEFRTLDRFMAAAHVAGSASYLFCNKHCTTWLFLIRLFARFAV